MNYKFNINHIVKVKLTDYGEKILNAHFKVYEKYMPLNCNAVWKTDELGYKTFQLWDLMNIFGVYIYPGAPICFENNEIIFNEKNLE